MAKINTVILYQRAFGLINPIPAVDVVLPFHGVDTIQVNETPQADYTSYLGTPIFFPLEIDGYLLPNEPLITVSHQKTIVKTVVQGLQGTVKEEINSDDYSISIKGIIVNDQSDEFPDDEVRKVRDICEKSGALEVKSPFLSIFGIEKIVIEGSTFFGIEGQQSQQAYEIRATSDRDVMLVIKEGV